MEIQDIVNIEKKQVRITLAQLHAIVRQGKFFVENATHNGIKIDSYYRFGISPAALEAGTDDEYRMWQIQKPYQVVDAPSTDVVDAVIRIPHLDTAKAKSYVDDQRQKIMDVIVGHD